MEFPLFLILTALFLSLFPRGIKPMVHTISAVNKLPLAINSPGIVQKDNEGNLHLLNGALAFQKKEKSHSIHVTAKNDENHSMRILASQKMAINDHFTNFAEEETNEKEINKIEKEISGEESRIGMGNLFFNGVGHAGGHHKNDELVDEKECPFEMDKPLVVICGATGTGKSDLAIEIAKAMGNGKGEVISADSMQIYKGLDIATNKVTVGEMAGIPHHLMSFLEPYVPNYDKWRFRNDAIKIIEQIWKRNGIPIVAGGSVSYIESLIYCKEKLEKPKNKIDLQHLFSKFPTSKALYERLAKIDPETAKEILPDNSARVIRELESFYSGEMKTETQILREKMAAKKGKKIIKMPMRYKNTLVIYLDMKMKEAHQINLDKRVEKMLVRGLWDELKEYYEKYKIYIGNNYQGWFGGMQTIGLNAFLPYLEMDEAERETENGKKMFEKCKKEFQKGDNKYAKLQRRNFYENILRPDEHRETPNVVGLNMSNNFHFKIVPFARELVKTFLDGQNFEEILQKKPGLVMKIVKPEEEK